MDDGTFRPEHEEEPTILLAEANETYWVLRGEEFLDPMLANDGYFPKPVRVRKFADGFEYSMFRQTFRPGESLWAVHPGIVDRLRRNEQLIEVTLSD